MGELQAIEIWRDEIRDKVFRRSGAATQPVTIFLGGQPGAGKTRGKNFALSQYEKSAVAEIIGDDFRHYHPEYKRLLTTDLLKMPDATATR